MCLLVIASQVVPGTPLLVGANRDEFLDRPTTVMTALSAAHPRVLGGRDEQSGGTWLAVNQHGVFGALTNQPLGEAKDLTKRTRGELPLALALHPTARLAAAALLADHEPGDYNGSWLMVGDRDELFYIDFTGQTRPEAIPLAPGIHVLENKPLDAPSPKAARMRHLLGALEGEHADATAALRLALADHWVPDTAADPDADRVVPCCVHLEAYGTRSSCILSVGSDPDVPPPVQVASGPPCTVPFDDVSQWWERDLA